MITFKNSRLVFSKAAYCSLLLAAALLTTLLPVFAQDKATETIDATAMGTSTQLGRTINVKVIIYRYSTPADKQVLVDAFNKGKSKGLVNALSKMKSVGRIAISGTVGTDLSYVTLVPSPTGRKIRFATNRPIRFAEAYNAGPSMDYDLTVGEFDLNDSDKSKSGGTLYPASQLIINKQGQLQFNLRRNAWKLVNIIDWNQAGSKK